MIRAMGSAFPLPDSFSPFTGSAQALRSCSQSPVVWAPWKQTTRVLLPAW